MVEITKKQIMKTADTARLEVTDEEADILRKELTDMFKSFDVLKELDTTDIEPTIHPNDQQNVFRNDESKEWITQEEALKNAKMPKNGQFQVPSILE